ncbi:MAG: hypothetical protein IJ916_00815 [Paludibacteraceae bacterium]|nr:hypothetical protein [Paludibacteraceae bacterium]MBR2260225.1 hypothetical protein [Paludibacteraceae bacterium]MEE3483839.1 hypothetical protein [Bacteroidales bacterium]
MRREINELEDFKLALQEVDSRIELSKKKIQFDVNAVKMQMSTANLIGSFCERVGDKVTLSLLDLIGRFLDFNLKRK